MLGWSCGSRAYQPLEDDELLHDLLLVGLAGQRLLDDLDRSDGAGLEVSRLAHFAERAVAQLDFDGVFFSNVVVVLHHHVVEAEDDFGLSAFGFISVFTCRLRGRGVFLAGKPFFAVADAHYPSRLYRQAIRAVIVRVADSRADGLDRWCR